MPTTREPFNSAVKKEKRGELIKGKGDARPGFGGTPEPNRHLFTSSSLTSLTVHIYTLLHTFLLWWCHLMEKSELFYTFEHIHQHIYISAALLYALKHTHIRHRVPGDNAPRICAQVSFSICTSTFRFSHRKATIYHHHSLIHSSRTVGGLGKGGRGGRTRIMKAIGTETASMRSHLKSLVTITNLAPALIPWH